MKKQKQKPIILAFIFGIFFIVLIGYLLFFANFIKNEGVIYVEQPKKINEVIKELHNDEIMSSKIIFDFFVKVFDIKEVPIGRYHLKKGLSLYQIAKKLKYGRQDAVRFSISNITTIYDIASKVGLKFKVDSAQFMNYLNSNEFKNKYDLDSFQILTHIFPYTYDIYWDSNPDVIFNKIKTGHATFWNKKHLDQLRRLNMDQKSLYILASMVQKEYTMKKERKRIAGVLINRLKINMPLQVDATCKYARRDFDAKRVTQYHTSFNSPFNTYKNKGLPPGPICVPEIGTLIDCLNPENHDFLYYCADPSLNGFHLFSKDYASHQKIARGYYEKMNALAL
jgi:UPF0755 protein